MILFFYFVVAIVGCLWLAGLLVTVLDLFIDREK